MKYTLLVLGLNVTAGLFAQKMLPAPPHPCAAGKQLLSPPPSNDLRSDSIDILHTIIRLNLEAIPTIDASCSLLLKAKTDGISSVLLDLEGLDITSASSNGTALTVNQQAASARIFFENPLQTNDTLSIHLSYNGVPVQDASGWGGVYNQNGYFYNLGVGFDADPHSFGRAWFPCFDNFVERSTFEFYITTPAGKPAYCNGYLVSENAAGSGLIQRHWRLDQDIPSYLACFATGPYVSWKRTYPSDYVPIPVEIAAAPGDTAKINGTFIHLQQAIHAFEEWYGPYQWNKIGYSLVPFNSGAMEHSTNIALMRSAVNGGTDLETLWAHELSHQWWGDLTTCSSAEDMWLNEGWAVYSEHLFTEAVYGPQAFQSAVVDNFKDVLENAHLLEGGYRAVSGLPHELTYGMHTYNKGAVVAHNLRGYLGDDLFRYGVRQALAHNRFSDWNSAALRDELSNYTGVNLNSFFDNWVFNPGFPHFSIDSFHIIADGAGYSATIYVKQKLRGAPAFFNDIPLEFTLLDADHNRWYHTEMVSGENTVVTFNIPFVPINVWVNTRWKITQARMDNERLLTQAGSINLDKTKMTLIPVLVPDSTLIRVEHHYATPDTTGIANPNGYRISTRYWTVDGDWPSGFDANANVFYDGRGQLDQLDAPLFDLTGNAEDSVRLLYRPAPGMPWLEFPTYTRNFFGPSNDAYGLLRIEHLQKGQYTVGKGASTVSTRMPEASLELELFPNPATDNTTLKSAYPFSDVVLIDASGRTVREWQTGNTRLFSLPLNGLPAGMYHLLASSNTRSSVCELVIR